MRLKPLFPYILILALFAIKISCDNGEKVNYIDPEIVLSKHPNDIYLRENILKEYGTAIRWRLDQKYLSKGQTADSIHENLVIPVTKLVENLWIEPFILLSIHSEKFIREHMPKELLYLGSYIYNGNGDTIQGYAESGARISLMNLNSYDLEDRLWLDDVLINMHHEFSHIVYQNHGLPEEYDQISSDGYLGEGWKKGVSLSDAIIRGMVSAYGTKNQYEDFAELTSRYLVLDSTYFNSTFLKDSECDLFSEPDSCKRINKGRELIRQKLSLIRKYYFEKFELDIDDLRDTIQKRMPVSKDVINQP
ncbi:substrate import-associated zinc metallohydrolase lipoprotein [Marinifilum sp.]|uniref:substrate import-associated zinc metallohydrolase lipoprotein n=1 Tax=Marinifilum sp. TaxID=2033137 RepID=UPI003BA8A7BA